MAIIKICVETIVTGAVVLSLVTEAETIFLNILIKSVALGVLLGVAIHYYRQEKRLQKR